MIVRDLLIRQITNKKPIRSNNNICVTSLLPRLTLEEILGFTNGRITAESNEPLHYGHAGCVNTIKFGHLENSSLLLSGSDDETLKLWDVSGQSKRITETKPSRKPIATYATGHTSFSVV
jgi:WD40 repeat protein